MFINREYSTSLVPFVETPFIIADSGRAIVNNMDSYLSAINQDASMQFDFKYEKETDKDFMNYLLDNGFDYLTASYLQKNASKETIEKVVSYVTNNAIPRE